MSRRLHQVAIKCVHIKQIKGRPKFPFLCPHSTLQCSGLFFIISPACQHVRFAFPFLILTISLAFLLGHISVTSLGGDVESKIGLLLKRSGTPDDGAQKAQRQAQAVNSLTLGRLQSRIKPCITVVESLIRIRPRFMEKSEF